MSLSVLLRISPESQGGWQITLSGPLDRPAFASLSAKEVVGIQTRVLELLRPLPVVSPGDDGRRVRAEEQAGRLLAHVLSPTRIASRLGKYRGVASERGEAIVLLVDSPDLSVLSLPWELLAWSPESPPVEDGRGDMIARLADGDEPVPALSGDGLRILLWCPTPEEPGCKALIRRLKETLTAQEVVYLSGSQTPDPSSRVDVLHLISHGDSGEAENTLVGNEDREIALGSAVAELAPEIVASAVVVLDVCLGGEPRKEQLHQLAGRMMLMGARACIAPADVVSVHASAAFAEGWYSALADGASLTTAVSAGRQSVRRLAHPHPDSRPANYRCYFPTLSAADVYAPVEQRWHPEGWPPLSDALSALLLRARAFSRSEGLGHLGIEHLANVMRRDEGEAITRGVAAVFARIPLPLWTDFSLLWPTGESVVPHLTPRLQRLWSESTAQEVTLDDLWRRLLTDRRMGLHVLVEHRLDEWSDGGSVGSLVASERTELTPAACFEVLWGPLDGMRLEPEDGEVLGRWDPKGGSECGLYREAALTDRRLHRKHLRYLRRGRVELLYKTDVIPSGASWSTRVRDRYGELEVCVGDILCLTPATWLRAVGE